MGKWSKVSVEKQTRISIETLTLIIIYIHVYSSLFLPPIGTKKEICSSGRNLRGVKGKSRRVIFERNKIGQLNLKNR